MASSIGFLVFATALNQIVIVVFRMFRPYRARLLFTIDTHGFASLSLGYHVSGFQPYFFLPA